MKVFAFLSDGLRFSVFEERLSIVVRSTRRYSKTNAHLAAQFAVCSSSELRKCCKQGNDIGNSSNYEIIGHQCSRLYVLAQFLCFMARVRAYTVNQFSIGRSRLPWMSTLLAHRATDTENPVLRSWITKGEGVPGHQLERQSSRWRLSNLLSGT